MPELRMQRRLLRWTVVLSVAVVAAFGLAAWSFVLAHQNAVERNRQTTHDNIVLCDAENRSSVALRRVLLLALHLAQTTPRIAPGDRKRAVAFYREALSFTAPLNCNQIRRTP